VPRNRIKGTAAAEPPPSEPAIIHPTGVYQVVHVRAMLGLRQSSLRREIREGRLRVNKRCGKYFFLGQQLLDWLAGGELKRRRAEEN
jgi:hypothetical protein